ncbi:hypothetical protein [Gordonia shandongensis]|uniref:hypothetical protein n=1 Tax=Gordonia shandongensis TaxID=376351 RepID=UPI001FE1BE58|nr:hypothetical protein [Gordonia shandongensis]
MSGPRSPDTSIRPGATGGTDQVTLRVLVYATDPGIRRQVLSALGDRLDPDLPRLEYLEVATAATVLSHLEDGGIDLAILDGEAAPVGGMGLAKQIRDEFAPCPPLLILIARADDRWLADWSRADATAARPVDPLQLPQTVVDLLR